MCHYLSFKIDHQMRIYVGNLSSHEGIDNGWSLRPDQAREAEWTKDDNGETLTVRVPTMDRLSEEWWIKQILRRWPNRQKLLASITEGRSYDVKYWYKDGKCHRDDGPGVECKNGDKYWYKNGECHRDDGPAMEFSNGVKHWYKEGKLIGQFNRTRIVRRPRMNFGGQIPKIFIVFYNNFLTIRW